MAGVMLSFGGLLSEVLQGGATGLTASDPGIVKILGGFVFPVGLVMCVVAASTFAILSADNRLLSLDIIGSCSKDRNS